MHEGWFGVILFGNVSFVTILFLYVSRYKKLVGFQLGMNISVMAGGFTSLTTGILLIMQYPFHFTTITILSTIIGMVVGGLFGSLFDYQTLITGYGNGLMMGIMAPMIGAVMNDSPMILLSFMELLLVSSYILLAVSVRKS